MHVYIASYIIIIHYTEVQDSRQPSLITNSFEHVEANAKLMVQTIFMDIHCLGWD